MKTRLTFSETLLVGLLMFGLFFGAGNLIFPTWIGHLAGGNLWTATLGFLVTAATLPAIGIIAAALSRSQDMVEMATPVCRSYAIFYSVLLFIAIGPAFAIPRNAATSFTIGIKPFLHGASEPLMLAIFSAIFFLGVLVLSLKPARLMDIIGRYLTPAFLVFLAILLIAVIAAPAGTFSSFKAQGAYATAPFSTGLLEGYQTMDALASVIFCLVVIEGVRNLGVTEPKYIAIETFKAGIFCIAAMGIIYGALTYMGGVSNPLIGGAKNGGDIFAIMSDHYFGVYGQLLIAIIVILACFKTSIGLVTSGAEFFNRVYPKISVKSYIYGFTAVSFVIANVGLTKIISGAVPVLFFLYPLTIVLIILALLYPVIGKSHHIYGYSILFTFVAASFDLIKYSPSFISNAAWAKAYVGIAHHYLPFYDLGFGWVVPALIGFVIGAIMHKAKGNSVTAAQ